MKRIYITDFDTKRYKPKELSSLVKPFLDPIKGGWSSNPEITGRRGCGDLSVRTVTDLNEADLVLVSEPLDHQHDRERYRELSILNRSCCDRGINAHVFVNGDFGKVHPQFSNIFYYRLGGFKSQLDGNNKGFFPLLSDQLKTLFNRDKIFVRLKQSQPTVGFCGHATHSIPKYFYEKAKFLRINARRIASLDFHLEPLFASAFERYNLLSDLEKSREIKANFIARKRYRAGAVTDEKRRATTIEYYQNIIDSDYVLCLRGGGNFSVRLYETLMMGRIPVFLNTDCLMPFEESIDWKRNVVWIEWGDRSQIASRIAEFHSRLSKGEFETLQQTNRDLWISLSLRSTLIRILSASDSK